MIDTNKPYKTGIDQGCGLPMVIKLVPDEVKEFLEIMEAVKGSYVERDNCDDTYYLYLPGQSRFEINKKYLAKILECLSEDILTGRGYLCELSLQTIRHYQK